jgi:Uma2 family endonuclease
MVTQTKRYTADDLWRVSHQPGAGRFELVKGVLIEMTPTGEAHGVIALWLGHLVLSFVEAHDLGEVTGAETGFRLAVDPDTVRAPDIGFIAAARLTAPTSERYFPGPPDLAVEIISPGDMASDIHSKVIDYLHAGTRLVWVVYPSSKTIAVYTGSTGATILDQDTSLDGGDILPGFCIPVHDVFKKLRE